MGQSRPMAVLLALAVGLSSLGPSAAVQFRGHAHRGAESGRNPFGSFFGAFGGGGSQAPAPLVNSSQLGNPVGDADSLNSTVNEAENTATLSADQAAIVEIEEAVRATNNKDDEGAEVAEIKRAASLAAENMQDDDEDSVPSRASAAEASNPNHDTSQSAAKDKAFDAGTNVPGAIGLAFQGEVHTAGTHTSASNETSSPGLLTSNESAPDLANATTSHLASSEIRDAPAVGTVETLNPSLPHVHATRPRRRRQAHRRIAHQDAEAAPTPAPETKAEPEIESTPSRAPAPTPAPRRALSSNNRSQDDLADYEVSCDESSGDCTRSMCRWLKMSNKDSKGRCSLFEWQLKSCDYDLPESRAAGSPEQPIDCAIEILRRPGVPAKEVVNNIRELDACVEDIPPGVNATCYVSLGLLRNEIHDWKQEAMLMRRVSGLRKDLATASAHGKTSLETGEHLQDSIDELGEVLEQSDRIPGHYLVNEVREARGYLDRLGPIPAVRKELEDGETHAREAFKTTSLWQVKQAMVWLEVSVKKARRLELNKEVEQSQQTLSDLAALKVALLDLKHAKFQANLSVSTKSAVPETLDALNASIHRASDAGLTDGMRTARHLLHELATLKQAVQEAADASANGNAILHEGGNKGKESLARAVQRLNASLARADVLGLADNGTVGQARGTYDGVLYILEARRALQKAQENGLHVLDTNGGDLSDNKEETASASIAPVLEWGGEVGLVNGLAAAASTDAQLRLVEHAKENMTLALATGNASLEAKAGMPEAISMLETAMETSRRSNTSAGVEMAKQQVESLRALLAARAALEDAKAKAVDSLRSRRGFEEAQSALNASVHQAHEVGLDKDAAIAAKDLRRLREFAEANSHLMRALGKSFPSREAPDHVNVTDPESNRTFRKKGLKVVDLLDVPGAQDDGDEDLQEHIDALKAGISASKKQGEIDPKMQAAYQTALGNRDAYKQLQQATDMGEASMRSKTGIEGSIRVLGSARREVEERGLHIGVREATALLEDLRRIPPALDAIRGAILKVNVSIHTTSTMDSALLMVNKAIELNKDLHLDRYLSVAEQLRDRLARVKQAYVGLRAASLQGKISLHNEDGEEAAMAELSKAIAAAQDAGVAKGVEDAQELHDELRHMNLQHDQLQNAMTPTGQ